MSEGYPGEAGSAKGSRNDFTAAVLCLHKEPKINKALSLQPTGICKLTGTGLHHHNSAFKVGETEADRMAWLAHSISNRGGRKMDSLDCSFRIPLLLEREYCLFLPGKSGTELYLRIVYI